MVHVFTSISRFTLILWMAFFTYESFASLRRGVTPAAQQKRYRRQTFYMYFILFNADLVIFFNTPADIPEGGRLPANIAVLILMLAQAVFLFFLLLIFRTMYSGSSKPLVNSMAMLLATGFILQTRLSTVRAARQLLFAVIGLILTCLIPLIIRNAKSLDRYYILYAVVGLVLLLSVLVLGRTTYGAKLSITFGSVTIQPSEFVKIIFVFFVASMFKNAATLKQIMITSGVALIHVIILVISRDLGSAGIFFITYLVMLYLHTKRFEWLLIGTAVMLLLLVAAYFLFSHVRVRFTAWYDPVSVANDAGYQICQSLFAIGTGGFFGSGLCEGMPEKIPLSHSDFAFSSISEELGGIFALLIIFLCIGVFLLFINAAMQIKTDFYKLLAAGLSVCYGAQTFIMIGGVTKFIPSTGVTLPLISYGGSSLISTMIIFAIIQGLYVRENAGKGGESLEEYIG